VQQLVKQAAVQASRTCRRDARRTALHDNNLRILQSFTADQALLTAASSHAYDLDGNGDRIVCNRNNRNRMVLER